MCTLSDREFLEKIYSRLKEILDSYSPSSDPVGCCMGFYQSDRDLYNLIKDIEKYLGKKGDD